MAELVSSATVSAFGTDKQSGQQMLCLVAAAMHQYAMPKPEENKDLFPRSWSEPSLIGQCLGAHEVGMNLKRVVSCPLIPLSRTRSTGTSLRPQDDAIVMQTPHAQHRDMSGHRLTHSIATRRVKVVRPVSQAELVDVIPLPIPIDDIADYWRFVIGDEKHGDHNKKIELLAQEAERHCCLLKTFLWWSSSQSGQDHSFAQSKRW